MSSIKMIGQRAFARSMLVFLLATSFAVLAAPPAQAASFVVPTRIMPLGDSITWGTGGNGGGGYRPPLVQNLVVGRYSSDMVGSQRSGPPILYDRDHEGYRGYRIDQLAALAPTSVTNFRPEFVLLQIGTNDVLQQFDLAAAPARLSSLIDLITDARPSARLVVASITPLADPALDADARAYNAEIPGIVAAKAAAGRQVSFLDMYPVITTADLIDGIHPNQGGYDKMAAAWSSNARRHAGSPSADLEPKLSLQRLGAGRHARAATGRLHRGRRGRREVQVREGRFHRRRPLLQGHGQHRHSHRESLDGDRIVVG